MEDIKIRYPQNEEIILINYFTNDVVRNNNEKGKFFINNNILKIKWDNNIEENFMKVDKSLHDDLQIYSLILDENSKIMINDINEDIQINEETQINVIHKSWNDYCIINKSTNILYRLSYSDEYGKYEINGNKLIIYWEKWNSEVFIFNNEAQ